MKLTSWQAFEREINPQLLPSILLIQSKDAFELKETLHLLLDRLKKPFKRVGIEDIEALLQEMSSLSLFAPQDELIVIENIERLKTLNDEFYQKRPGRCLILTSLGVLPATLKKIDAVGLVLDIPEVKAWEKQSKLQDWILLFCSKQGKRIQRDAAALLAKEYVTDRFTLEQELEKLFAYVIDKNDITLKDVQDISCISDKSNLWQLHETILQKNATEALKILHGLDLNDLHPLQIIRNLRNQFQQAVELSVLHDARVNFEEIGARFPQLKGKFLEKKLSAATNYGTFFLKKALVQCDKVEVDLKNSTQDEELALEKLVITLST
jgi:DNA polymerase III subunit delta